ncbi:hypothetical protein BV898_02523 [Hypsibius exemplaris]|uniref:C2H2-type domain-containing protein n=1 Tax=Hypsibius exemplaris TaxID=2072580 RepID=A0A1W0X8T1_HYPEX|nr:hypothetical protein BV898_02523 [Hypsibius exemplaris]
MEECPLLDARVGYPCLYPHCKERRTYLIQLVEHVERDHTSRDVLERMVIRDKMGNIIALPPHCVYRYFPDVGLSPDAVHEIMDTITSKERSSDPLLSSASLDGPAAFSSTFTALGAFVHNPPDFYSHSSSSSIGQVPTPRPINSPLSVQARAFSSTLNGLLVNTTAQEEKTSLINQLNLRQRIIQQQQQRQSGESHEPNLVVAGLRQLLSAPATPLLQQLVQATKTDKHHPQLHYSTGKIEANSISCSSPAPSINTSVASCSTPPAPSPDSGRGSESSTEESIDQIDQILPLVSGNVSGNSVASSCDDNSNDSWMQREDYSTEAIVNYSRCIVGKRPKTSETDKPYACPVPHCGKAYKNMNGIKYHARAAHRIRKPHRCACNKKYCSEEKYLAHCGKCPKSRKGNESRTVGSALRSTTSSLGNPAPTSSTCASAVTTPTLHQLLLSRGTSSNVAVTSNTATSLPSIPSVFGPARSGGGASASSLLHNLLDG